jgi:hypothetical protein
MTMCFLLLFPSFVVYDDDDDDDEKTTLFNIMCAETTQTLESFAMKSEESASRVLLRVF